MKNILHLLAIIIVATFLWGERHKNHTVNAAANNTQETPAIPGSPTITPNAPPLAPSTPDMQGTKLSATKKNPIFQSSKYLTYNDKTKTYHIWGNVKIQQKDTVLTADDATFNEVTQLGVITGNPKLTKPGVVITGDKINVFYKEQKAIIDGNVHAIYDSKQVPEKNNNPMKSKNNKKKDEEPVHMYAPHAVFYWKNNQGEITGGVRVEQNDKSITSNEATFDNNINQIIFIGNVLARRGKDDTMTSQKLTLNTLINEAIAEGNVEAVVMVEESEDKNSSKTKDAKTKEKPKSRREMREEEAKQKEKQKEQQNKKIELDQKQEVPIKNIEPPKGKNNDTTKEPLS